MKIQWLQYDLQYRHYLLLTYSTNDIYRTYNTNNFQSNVHSTYHKYNTYNIHNLKVPLAYTKRKQLGPPFKCIYTTFFFFFFFFCRNGAANSDLII